MMLFKMITTLFVLIVGTNAQCLIPNGNFEDWSLHPKSDSSDSDYYMPNGGWNENFLNVATRSYSNAGFFYRYEDSDAQGFALKLASGSSANGFIRFACDDLPTKIKGRYKFSNTGCDDFIIYAYAVSSNDTLETSELFQGTVHATAKSFQAPISESFHEFEIELDEFKTINPQYFVIMTSIEINGSCTRVIATGDTVRLNDAQGFAVLDELELVYDSSTPLYENQTEIDDFFAIHHNSRNSIELQFNHDRIISGIYILNPMGEIMTRVSPLLKEKPIDISQLPPGNYWVTIISDGQKFVKRFNKY